MDVLGWCYCEDPDKLLLQLGKKDKILSVDFSEKCVFSWDPRYNSFLDTTVEDTIAFVAQLLWSVSLKLKNIYH